MIFISILIIIVAIALPSLRQQLSPILLLRISSIIMIYAGALSLNAFYIQSIGSGIGIYSGFFHVTTVSQLLDTFIFLIGALILIAWPSITNKNSSLGILQTNSQIIINQNKSTNPMAHHQSNSLNPVQAQVEGVKGENLNITPKRLYNAAEYSLIVLFSTLGASLLVSSADLISMYLSIELQSFGVYILSTLYRDSESSTAAGLKYFLLGGLSSCLILLGSGLIYSYTGLTNFESIYSIVSVSDSPSITQGLSLGLIIMIIGFLFKIAAAPLHHWSIDVYDDTPTIVTIWLTTMPKISIVIFLLELQSQIGLIENNVTISSMSYLIDSVSSIYVLKNLLLISSLLSLIIGTVVGLAQSRLKRLLAYSTVSHIGFILLALAINSKQSVDSLIFYIIQYSITNLNTFLIILALGYILKSSVLTIKKLNNSHLVNKGSETDIKFISELKGQFFSNPLLSISLTVCLFSMAGIPPLMGFFAKQFVLYSAIQSGYYFMAILGIIVSVISASYYLKIIRVLHSPVLLHLSEDQSKSVTSPITPITTNGIDTNDKTLITSDNYSTNNSELMITNFHSFLISTLTLSILFFVLKPSLLLNSTQLLSLSLFYY